MIQTELGFGRSEETGLIRKNLSHLSNLLTNIFTKNMNKRNIFIVLYIKSQTTFSSGSVWLKARLFHPELNSHPLGTDFSDGEPFPLFTLLVQECEVKDGLTLQVIQ